MTWYELLLFVHIACAIIWLGGGFLFQVYGMIELRTGDAAAIARFAGNAGRIGERLFAPRPSWSCWRAVGLMLNGDWPWGQALGGLRPGGVRRIVPSRDRRPGPTAKRIEKVGPESDEGQQLIRRVFALLRVDLLFLFAIVFAMVVKPTGDDTLVVVIVALVLLAGSAAFLRGVRVPRAA